MTPPSDARPGETTKRLWCTRCQAHYEGIPPKYWCPRCDGERLPALSPPDARGAETTLPELCEQSAEAALACADIAHALDVLPSRGSPDHYHALLGLDTLRRLTTHPLAAHPEPVAARGAETTDDGEHDGDCPFRDAMEGELFAAGIRKHPDEGSYSAWEWAQRVIEDVREAAHPEAGPPTAAVPSPAQATIEVDTSREDKIRALQQDLLNDRACFSIGARWAASVAGGRNLPEDEIDKAAKLAIAAPKIPREHKDSSGITWKIEEGKIQVKMTFPQAPWTDPESVNLSITHERMNIITRLQREPTERLPEPLQ